MTNSYRLAVFDWEGTLADTLGQVIDVIRTQACALNLPMIDEVLARQYISYGFVVTLKKLFPQIKPHTLTLLIENIQNTLSKKPQKIFLNPYAYETVEKLHIAGIDLAIATNKGHSSLMKALQVSGLESFFKVVRCANQTQPKPSPQMLSEILSVFDCDANDAIMIGDSQADVDMASALKVDMIGVNFFNLSEVEHELKKSGALAVFSDFKQVLKFLGLENG